MSKTAKIFTMSCTNYIITTFFNGLASVLGAYFLSDIKMSTGLLGILFSMGGILTAIVATLPGHIVDRIGAKRGMIFTCIAQLVAFGLFPFAHTPAMLMIIVSINSLATAFSVPCNTQVLSVLGVKDPAKLLRINMVGTSIAGMIVAPTAPMLIEKLGMTWRGAFGVFFCIAAVIGIIGIVVVSNVKYDVSEYATAKSTPDGPSLEEKKYRFTKTERLCCLATSLLYIGYMTVNVVLSIWQPTLLALKGFNGIEAAIPTTIATFVSLASFFLLPMFGAKILRSSKSTPIVFALNIIFIFGSMADNLVIICIARAFLTVSLCFLIMHIQSDMALTAPKRAAGRYSTVAQSLANAITVITVILIGYISGTAQLVMLIVCGTIGIIGALLFIKPAKEIAELKAADAARTGHT